MGLIQLSGIKVYAYHGCLEEEAKIGGHYVVNISVDAELSQAEQSDNLEDTIDYGRVTEIVHEQMAVRSNLIEHVASRVLNALTKAWIGAVWEVEVVKIRPPINGNVDEVSYTIHS